MLSVLFNKYKVKPFVRDRQSQHLQTQTETDRHTQGQIDLQASHQGGTDSDPYHRETEIDTENMT